LKFNYLKENKLLGNFLSLISIQFVNLILPILTIPFLIEKLGIYNFGLVSYVFTLMLYLVSVVDYGFTYSATKEVSINRNNLNKLSEIFNSVQFIKLIFITIIFVILYLSVSFFNLFDKDYGLLYISFTILIGQGLQSLYFFQGLEKMKFLGYFNAISKILYATLIFTFIKNKDDYKLAVLFFGLTSFIPFILGFYIIKFNLKIKFKLPHFEEIKKQLKEGWSLFISNLSISVLINSNIIILAYFVSMDIVGNFSVAEKLLVLSRAGLIVILQSTYPHICMLAKSNINEAVGFTRKVFFIILILFSVSVPVIYLGSDFFSFLISGSSNDSVANLLRLMCIIPLIIGLNVPASQILLALNHQKVYSYIMISAAFINLIANIVLTKHFGVFGTVLCIYITEFFITASLYIIIKLKHNELFFLNF
jgi:PST family polysaccharide transporter